MNRTKSQPARAGMIALAVSFAVAVSASAAVYYEVGPGQTYSTIQAAIDATPWNPGVGTPQPVFTDSHIINIHAGTYNETVQSDFFSHLNGQLSRTSLSNRLIIQANPGDQVIVNTAGAWNIRESNVTIQGLKFTGISSNPNGYYISLGTGGAATPNRQRGNIIIYNNEFDGARGLQNSYNDVEPGVSFSFASINNYTHDFESHYEVPGPSLLKNLTAGNVYARWGTLGGASIFRPDTSSGYDNRWYINNTLYTTNNALTGFLRASALDLSNITWANNIAVYEGPSTKRGLFFDSAASDGLWPTMDHNVEYGANLAWAYVGGTTYNTLANWNTYLAAHADAEVNSLYTDPLFKNAAASNFRIDLYDGALTDSTYWDLALADLGIAGLFESYWNPARDIGYQHGLIRYVGALQGIPEPGVCALLALGGLLLWRRRD